MTNMEKLLIVKSRGRGGIHIQQHPWSVVQRSLHRLRKPSLDSTMDRLLDFASGQLPKGRRIFSVEIVLYAFDKDQNPVTVGRDRIR
jgi:hypothetical protein